MYASDWFLQNPFGIEKLKIISQIDWRMREKSNYLSYNKTLFSLYIFFLFVIFIQFLNENISVRVRLLLLISEKTSPARFDHYKCISFTDFQASPHHQTKPTTNHVTNFNLMVRLIFIILEFIAFEFHWTDELKLLLLKSQDDGWDGRLLVLFYACYGGAPIPSCPSASILLNSIFKYN